MTSRPIPRLSAALKERFWSGVSIAGGDECWIWNGPKNKKGYGKIGINGRVYLTHRVACRIAHGPIPRGLYVLHACDNRPCCNPKHLSVGTQQDNMNDAVARGRRTRGEAHALARLTREQVIAIRENRTLSNRQLANIYGSSRGTISRIRSLQTRKYD